MDPCMQKTPQTIPQVIRQAAARYGTRAAIVDGELTLSYEALVEGAQTAARALVGLGVEPGDRVALWAPNRADWILACLLYTSRCV